MPGISIDDRLFKALTYLGETDEALADLKKAMLHAEEKHKLTLAAYFKSAEGNIEERKAEARICAEKEFLEYLEAGREHDAMNNKRKTQVIVVEVLRSMMADRRKGNVL